MHNRTCCIFFLLFTMSFTHNAWCNPQDYWQCVSHDSLQKKWLVKSFYSISANYKALEACKKQSQDPRSCVVTPEEDCEGFYDGQSTRPNWQCTAIDELSRAWKSTAHLDQDNAVFAALEHCKKHSQAPDTCYVNVLTCDDLNSR